VRFEFKRIQARDGYELAATVYPPDPRRYSGRVVILASGMGIQRGFYRRYASHLAAEGFPTVTFDYRGIGDSRPEKLRRFRARLQDWGDKDLAGVIDWAARVFPEADLYLVGHSVGGQIVGLADNRDLVRGMVAITCQSAYWKHWKGRDRLGVYLMWHVVMPTVPRLLGFFPSRYLGLGEDLPEGVARDWAWWGRHPHYLHGRVSEEIRQRYERFTGTLRVYSFTDDRYAPLTAVRGFLRLYPNAAHTHRAIAPRDLDLPSIGHFGFFREKAGALLWHETVAWLRALRPERVPVTPA
jgi:predicted alpha/beta hydrolase